MSRLLTAAALIGFSLAPVSPIKAMATTLACGQYAIEVSGQMESFWLKRFTELQEIEGYAKYTLEQVDFEYIIASEYIDIKHIWSINRKSLSYTHSIHARSRPNGMGSTKTDRATGYEPRSREAGQCSIS